MSSKITINDMHILAKERGGECLSNYYKNTEIKLKWKCCNGHEFEMKPASVKRGRWCKYCNNNISEEICRQYFQQLFKKEFIKIRPKWLMNENGQRLELDGYNEELKIAFEHQGLMHYKYIPYFHKTEGNFHKKQKRDLFKKERCNELGVFLISIPEIGSLTKLEDLKQLIKKECIKGGIPLPEDFDNTEIELELKSIYSQEKMQELKDYANSKGGECLSNAYTGRFGYINWKCKCGYKWKATPANVINKDSWCPRCAGKPELGIKDAQEIARLHGGKCLSDTYINSISKLKFVCNEGHFFETTMATIRGGSWCITCGGREKLTIDEMHEMAKANEGECLSNEYINAHTKLMWRCKHNHIFEVEPTNIRAGSWCWECGRESLRMGIEKMKEEAKKRNGECLSTTYKNNKTKLQWKCGKGHIWEMEPRYILNFNKWCPVCKPSRNRTLEDMQKLANTHEGKCLSESYKNTVTPLLWECKLGHTFTKKPESVERGKWCPECRERKIKLHN